MSNEKIAILDAGSQYGKLIDRKVRQNNCYCDLLPLDTKASLIANNYKGIIISGGPSSFEDKNAPRPDNDLLDLNIPILGICYGMQWLCIAYNGKVERGNVREDGQIDIEIDNSYDLFTNLQTPQTVLLTHGDNCTNIPNDLIVIARSTHAIASIKHKNKPYYGVQFHPEVDLTIDGLKILSNFLFKICKLKGDFKIENRIDKAINEIQSHVGNKDVVVLVSGGVDSTICCALLYKALGINKVHAIHIDTGLMRMNEDKLVKEALEKIGFNLHIVYAWNIFANATTFIHGKQTLKLCETINPEEKRKIIGDTFINVILNEIEKLGLKDYFLAQGTLRPDLIESASHIASDKAAVIKTHHNDTALVREKRKEGLIVEPLKDYHKDEVRQLGRLLNLPESVIQRHPFPGPGLAIRILCYDNKIGNNYDDHILDELNEDLKKICSNYNYNSFLLPIKSVGVQGDGRSYSYVAALTGAQDWTVLFKLAKEIPKLLHQINRVVFIFGDAPLNVTTTTTYLNDESIDILKNADYIVNQKLQIYENGFYLKKISQFPVVLIPVSFDIYGKRSIVLRPFLTHDFMTGLPAQPGLDIPLDLIKDIVDQITNEVDGVSRVLIDMTSKPPGTTEWE